MSETILTAENLKFRYDAEQPVYALDGVSAQVKRGEFVAAVSYTHLDVYKRQGRCGISAVACLLQAIVFPRHGFHKSTVFFGRIIAVSYTHLDVYKRQGVGRLNNGARVQIPPTPPRKSLVVS